MVRSNKRGLRTCDQKLPNLDYFVTFLSPILNNLNRTGPHFPLDMPGKGPLSHKPPPTARRSGKCCKQGLGQSPS